MARHEQLLEHQDFLRRIARALVPDAQRADDLVQEVWLTGLEHPPRHGRNLRAWLKRVLIHRASSERRAESRRSRREEAVARDESLPADQEALERIELQRQLLDALAELPESSRTAMVMRYYDGLTAPAIAERLGVSPNTVKSRLRRGLAALRVHLDRRNGGDRERWVLALAPLTKDALAPAAAVAVQATSAAGTWSAIMAATTTKWMVAGVAVVAVTVASFLGPDDGARDSVASTAKAVEHERDVDAPPAGEPLLAAAADPAARVEHVAEVVAEQTVVQEEPAAPVLPALVVRDARSGAGIPVFTLISRDLPMNSLRDQGTFETENGRLTAADEPGLVDLETGRRRFTVWAEGYAMKIVEVADFTRRTEVVVDLEVGDVPRVRGVVLDRGVPVADAEVALCPYRKLNWFPAELEALVETRSDRRGGFELAAGPGGYVVRVVCDAGRVYLPIELPVHEALTIDVGELGSLTVVVRDAGGDALADIICILRPAGDNSRDERLETDEHGRATFSNVEPGDWRVSLHGTQERFQNQPWVEREVTLGAGEDRELPLEAPSPDEPRRARLVVDGGSPQGWHAQTFHTDEWAAAGAAGDLDIDLNLGSYVKVRSPQGAIWNWSVPPYDPAGDVTEIHVPATRFSYGGRVLSRTRGRPFGRCEVFCYVSGGDKGGVHTVSAPTDAEGRFVLPVVEDRVTSLSFRIEGTSGGDTFVPELPPSTSPPLELRVFANNTYDTDPTIPLTPVSGTVFDGRDGTPVVEGYLRINAIFDEPQGRYSVSIDSANTKTASDGTWAVEVPVADRYVVRVWEEWTNDARKLEVEKGPIAAGAQPVWELILP